MVAQLFGLASVRLAQQPTPCLFFVQGVHGRSTRTFGFARSRLSRRRVAFGLLTGLGDPQLVRVLVAVHEQAGQPWSLEQMAQTAGMSRSTFASPREWFDGRG
jgi:transcriptional regulator GlxA family with amidase domain